MNFKNYFASWEGTQQENKHSRRLMILLAVIILFLIFALVNKKTIVTIQPWTLTQEAWITESDASQSYKEAWGFALAELLGNVTPDTVGFIKDRITPLLSPSVYQDVIDALSIQAEKIRQDKVTMRFEPKTVYFEAERNRVFIYGYSFVSGTSTLQPERTNRTYEFEIKINHYAPTIAYIDTYQGQPKTSKELKKIESQLKAREARGNHE